MTATINAEILTTAEAAKLLGVHVVTMRKWREKSEIYQGVDLLIFEDCQGLLWHYQHARKIAYCAASVQRLKRILNRRKSK